MELKPIWLQLQDEIPTSTYKVPKEPGSLKAGAKVPSKQHTKPVANRSVRVDIEN